MKALIWIAAIALVSIGGFYAFNKYQQQTGGSSTQQTASEEGSVEKNLTKADFSWRVENAPNYEETFPRQVVYLDVKGRSYKAGESIGCNIKQDAVERDEVTRQTCWFGGGGDVYSIFLENSSYTLKHRWIQESGGPEVNAAREGPWETIVIIN